ncbi:Short C-terminal domain-containing protein [Halomicrobium zhouii]|uniref:Short C-terminal domain-containing protein n=1 Tax=Halomicrobium zhouii TaxID=767519 RepID=A0A1I6LV43_9EURY|nr:SHOCT domain-containing protein [Halomicrobium zhouii]SFS07323.1 Short C-terminal domain-containing protein [Halomicrobium zhouii]
MFGLVDRYVPDAPRPRLTVGAALVTLGVPVTLYAFFALWWPIQMWMYVGRLGSVLVLLTGLFTVAAGNHLLKDVAERASAVDSTDDVVADAATSDPLSTLRRRYAAGDLTDDEFERKLARLTEDGGSAQSLETGTEQTIAE